MTAKSVRAWAVVTPDGLLDVHTTCATRRNAQETAMMKNDDDRVVWWRDMYRLGYRCVRVIVKAEDA